MEVMEINTWLSKTFCRHHDCDRHISNARKLLAMLHDIRVKDSRVVEGWRHYCGARPRWVKVIVNDDGSIDIYGGKVWQLRYAPAPRGWVEETDGCWDKEFLTGMLTDMLEEATGGRY